MDTSTSWVEGDDPNESTMKAAVSYISAQIPSSLLPWLRWSTPGTFRFWSSAILVLRTQHNIILIYFPLKDAKGVDTSYPHRKLTLFHALPVDARTAITLAAGGEWLSETLDVLFGKRDVYPSAVVLPNRSVGDAFVWYSKLFSYLYRFATVWLDTMRWQPQLGRMGMKVEGAGKKGLFPIGSPLYQALVRPIHDWAMTVLARFKMEGTYNQTQPLQYLRGNKKRFSFDLKAATDSLPVILTSCMIAGLFGNPFATSWTFILCSVVFQLPYSL